MKTIIITGSYPPDVCGVGDYVKHLMNTEASSQWHLFYKKQWGITNLGAYIAELTALKPDKIFMQYPTQGYGWNLLPHFLCVYFSFCTKIRFIPVLHEYSELTLKARLALQIIIFAAKEMVVTNVFERNVIVKRRRWLANHIKVIKICSNISAAKNKKSFTARYIDIAYFGQIRPTKGIESFLCCLGNYKSEKQGLNTAIIGSYPLMFKDYFQNIAKDAREKGIELLVGKPPEDVAELLNDTKILFLPFPDGCSERRGSYLAGLKNGCVIVTTKGKYTTASMMSTAFFVNDIRNTDGIFSKLLTTMNDEAYTGYQSMVNSYLSAEIPSSWNMLAQEYNSI